MSEQTIRIRQRRVGTGYGHASLPMCLPLYVPMLMLMQLHLSTPYSLITPFSSIQFSLLAPPSPRARRPRTGCILYEMTMLQVPFTITFTITILLLILLLLQVPFSARSLPELAVKITTGGFSPVSAPYGEQMRLLVTAMLQKEVKVSSLPFTIPSLSFPSLFFYFFCF